MAVSLVLGLIILVVLVIGERTYPHVVGFNLEGQVVPVRESLQMKIEFSRPMDRAEAEEAFSLEPSLEGDFSWSARTMVYTCWELPEPGVDYEVRVGEARDESGKKSRPYTGDFTAAEASEG